MKDIGIFFGSDTGNTEKIAKYIQSEFGKHISNVHDIADSKREDIERYSVILLGTSTWYYGELQCDWDDFSSILKKTDFSKKTVAFFGCGDQEDYSEYFCDGIGILFNMIKTSHIHFVGKWPIQGYCFENSKALYDNQQFLGLIIDEDRQPEKSKKRVNTWVQQLKRELQNKKILY
ncbi:MAG: flavodoxin FldA [Buchnera aphidicola (Nurudea shiraii)]